MGSSWLTLEMMVTSVIIREIFYSINKQTTTTKNGKKRRGGQPGLGHVSSLRPRKGSLVLGGTNGQINWVFLLTPAKKDPPGGKYVTQGQACFELVFATDYRLKVLFNFTLFSVS